MRNLFIAYAILRQSIAERQQWASSSSGLAMVIVAGWRRGLRARGWGRVAGRGGRGGAAASEVVGRPDHLSGQVG